MSQKLIVSLLRVCAKAINRTDSTLTYDRTIEAIIRLAEEVHSTETDDDTWYLEEYCLDLGSLIIGAYWYCSDYHGGQNSPEYSALCALSSVFKPGCTSGCEPDSTEQYVYECLVSLKG